MYKNLEKETQLVNIKVKKEKRAFLSDPMVKKLSKSERNWLLKHCEFTLLPTSLKNAQKAIDVFESEGVANVTLWTKDRIHPIEKHFREPLITLYAGIEEAHNIKKIAKKAGVELFSVHHYTEKHSHPLVSDLYPIDVMDAQEPIFNSVKAIIGLKFGGFRLYEAEKFLKLQQKLGNTDKAEIINVFYLFDDVENMMRAKLWMNLVAYRLNVIPSPKLEFGNIVGPLLFVQIPTNEFDACLDLLKETCVKNTFIGPFVKDATLPALDMLTLNGTALGAA